VLEIALGMLAVLLQSEKRLRRDGDARSPPSGAQIMSAAQTLSTEEFVRSYPDEWLQHRQVLERIVLAAAQSRASVWSGDLHQKNRWICGAPGVGKSQWAAEQSPMTTTLKKTRDDWWDGDSLALINGGIVENYPPSPEGDRLAAELKNGGDRYPFLGGVKGSTTLVDPGKFTLIMTSNYSIGQCFRREQDRAAMRSEGASGR
jgi:hypothetical protein